jgi:ubiquinone/menaquinone biosynthesis C-methylase UbiE
LAKQKRFRLSHKIIVAVKHPRRIPPYGRRLARDLWLRTRFRDHVSYYRAVMKSDAMASPIAAVGSRSPEQWQQFGQMQFDYLVKHGLKPDDRLLEIGCGNLRAGRLFIGYLGTGNYYGIDISPEMLLAAQRVLADSGLQHKLPRLTLTDSLTFAFLPDGYFTAVHAHSVFSHCPVPLIEECFAHVGRVMAPGAIFDFTFFRSDGADYHHVLREDFYYSTETLERLARRHGFRAQIMDDWIDPWDFQPKMRLTREP